MPTYEVPIRLKSHPETKNSIKIVAGDFSTAIERAKERYKDSIYEVDIEETHDAHPRSDINGNPKKTLETVVYRAANNDYAGPGTVWAYDRATAEVYLDNPPFGGHTLYVGIINPTVRIGYGDEIIARHRQELAEALIERYPSMEAELEIHGLVAGTFMELSGRAFPMTMWEDHKAIRKMLSEHYDIIRYIDNYPDGADVMVVLNNGAIIQVEEIDEDEQDKDRENEQFVPWEETKYKVQDVPEELRKPKDYSEAKLHEHALKIRAFQTEPATFKEFPIGTRTKAPDGDIWELREYSFNDPRLIFPEGLPKNLTVDKYIRWINEGYMPPPLKGLETYKHNINILEGHHRASALIQSGINTIKVWVNLLPEDRNP